MSASPVTKRLTRRPKGLQANPQTSTSPSLLGTASVRNTRQSRWSQCVADGNKLGQLRPTMVHGSLFATGTVIWRLSWSAFEMATPLTHGLRGPHSLHTLSGPPLHPAHTSRLSPLPVLPCLLLSSSFSFVCVLKGYRGPVECLTRLCLPW